MNEQGLWRVSGGAALRHAMRELATGVTVVTTVDGNGHPAGATVNAVASLSLEPPLVLVCLRDDSDTLTAIRHSGIFAVNVLSEDQADLALRFAAKGGSGKWSGVEFFWCGGLPVLTDTLATVRCSLASDLDGGDHRILLGAANLTRADDSGRQPLLFFRGDFPALESPTTFPGAIAAA